MRRKGKKGMACKRCPTSRRFEGDTNQSAHSTEGSTLSLCIKRQAFEFHKNGEKTIQIFLFPSHLISRTIRYRFELKFECCYDFV